MTRISEILIGTLLLIIVLYVVIVPILGLTWQLPSNFFGFCQITIPTALGHNAIPSMIGMFNGNRPSNPNITPPPGA